VLEPVDAGVELVEVAADDGAHELGERQLRERARRQPRNKRSRSRLLMPLCPPLRGVIDVKELEGRVATVAR